MKEIGGFFNLELAKRGEYFRGDAIFLNSGRNALEYILRSLGEVSKLWMPFYTCNVVLEPLLKLGITYDFFSINNQLELDKEILLGENEYILVNNYYGLKDDYMIYLAAQYGERLIIDNSQALYSKHIDGINTIYSPKKFVGVPDGGIAYCNNPLEISLDKDKSYHRCRRLLRRYDEGASACFQDTNDKSYKLAGIDLMYMSTLTKSIMNNIDFEYVKDQRLTNFNYLHTHLLTSNKFDLENFKGECPMIYPYICEDDSLRNILIRNKIYVAKYWSNVKEWSSDDSYECYLMNNLIPLPIDQRYDIEDMQTIIDIIDIINNNTNG